MQSEDEGAVRCALGVDESGEKVAFSVGGYRLVLTPDEADQLSADIREASIVARNGGRLT